MDTADITIGFVCTREEMVRDRIESVHFDRHQIDHEILSIAPGRIPEGQDECDLPEYRRAHGLGDAPTDSKWAWRVPEGCTGYVARVRLRDAAGGAMTRDRILAIPFGDRDLGFSIDGVAD